MRYEFEILEDFLLGPPNCCQFWALRIPFSRVIVNKAMGDERASAALIEALKTLRVDDCRFSEDYIKPTESNVIFTRIGQLMPSDYWDDLKVTSLEERARLGLIANTLASVQDLLSSFLTRIDDERDYGVTVDDIFGTLANPSGLLDISPVAAYIYAGVRNELIVPLFGSVENVYVSFQKLRRESYGFIQGLKNVRYYKANESRVRSFFAPEHEIQAFISLQVALQPQIKDLLSLISQMTILEEYVPGKGANPAVHDYDDPIAELILGFRPDTRKWLMLEEGEEDEEASQGSDGRSEC